MHPLLSKTSRVGLMYVVLCALALGAAQRWRLALCTDGRDGAIRELSLDPRAADVLFLGSSQTARGLIPAVFDARCRELTGREVRSVNLAPFGAGRHIGYLELVRWLDRNPRPSVVAVEVGVLSDVVETPHEVLSRFETPLDALRIVRTAPYVHRDAREQKRRAGKEPLFDPLGLFRSLDRRALHVELALDAFGRGPEDCVRAAFILVRSGAPYWKPSEPDLAAIVAAQAAEAGYYRITPDSPDGREGRKRIDQRNREITYDDALAQPATEGKETFADPSRYLPAKLYARAIADLCRE